MLKARRSIPEKIIRLVEFEERQGKKVAMWELNMKLEEFCGEKLSYEEANAQAYKMAEGKNIEIWYSAAAGSQFLRSVPRRQNRVSFEGDFSQSVKFPITGDQLF